MLCSVSFPTPLSPYSASKQSWQGAGTATAPTRADTFSHRGDHSSLPTPKQTVSHRGWSNLPDGTERDMEEPLREHALVDVLGKMIGDLHIMCDHLQTSLPTKREVQPPTCHDFQFTNYPEDPSPITSHRVAPTLPEYSNPAYNPHWYSKQTIEPGRAAHRLYSDDCYEPQRPRYLRPTHRASTLHPDERESTYRGPTPTILDFITGDPGEFTPLKIALENLLPPNATELFRYQILMDHLRSDKARLVADSYLNSPFLYTDTMAALTERFGQP